MSATYDPVAALFNLSQTEVSPNPVTLTAATTIAPVGPVTFVAGTTAIAQITPPLSGVHEITIIMTSTNPSGFVTTGNIIVASVTNGVNWQNRPNKFVYNPLDQKYYPLYSVIA